MGAADVPESSKLLPQIAISLSSSYTRGVIRIVPSFRTSATVPSMPGNLTHVLLASCVHHAWRGPSHFLPIYRSPNEKRLLSTFLGGEVLSID